MLAVCDAFRVVPGHDDAAQRLVVAGGNIPAGTLVVGEHVFDGDSTSVVTGIQSCKKLYESLYPRDTPWRGLPACRDAAARKAEANCFSTDGTAHGDVYLSHAISAFNHDDRPNAMVTRDIVKMDADACAVCLLVTAIKPIQKGEEICISYSAIANSSQPYVGNIDSCTAEFMRSQEHKCVHSDVVDNYVASATCAGLMAKQHLARSGAIVLYDDIVVTQRFCMANSDMSQPAGQGSEEAGYSLKLQCGRIMHRFLKDNFPTAPTRWREQARSVALGEETYVVS
jgi:hypothetical protein